MGLFDEEMSVEDACVRGSIGFYERITLCID